MRAQMRVCDVKLYLYVHCHICLRYEHSYTLINKINIIIRAGVCDFIVSPDMTIATPAHDLSYSSIRLELLKHMTRATPAHDYSYSSL